MTFSRRSPRMNRRGIGAVASAYNYAADPQILARFRASGGLNDLSAANTFGPLVQQVAAVATGADADGNTVWQFRNASGGYYAASTITTLNNPIYVILIAKAGPAPAINQGWFSSGFGWVNYNNAASLHLTSASSQLVTCTPANNNMFEVYMHNNASRYCVNNGAPSATIAPGANTGTIKTVVLGANFGGGNRADVDIAEIIILRGPPTATFLAGLNSYVRGRYPSLGISATPHTPISAWATALGGGLVAPFDFFAPLGQSNNMGGLVATGTPTSPGALGFELGNDNAVKAAAPLYDDQTAVIDSVISNTLTGKVGGNGTAAIAQYTATTGMPCVICPCSQGSSSLRNNWFPTLGGGLKQRDQLYGRALDRIRNLIALGGTLRFITWYQGESDIGGANVATYGADLDFFLTSFWADLGLPEHTIIQPLANSVGGSFPSDVASLQAQVAALASPGKRIVLSPSNGPYEADGIHLQATPQNTIGVNIANAAIAAGWL